MANEKHYCPAAFLSLLISSVLTVFFMFLGINNLIAASQETFDVTVTMLRTQSYLHFAYAGFSLILGLSVSFACYFTTKALKTSKHVTIKK
jgi:hypothetical protein